ncbi:MAG: TldD/PmbA family protein [Bacteroidales bacterium]|jgi:PmbA protein|nr:TldD/PmbA family protein [Bacteroidales bacterium]
MDTDEKYEIANLVMRHAIKCGADEVAVTIGESSRSDIEIREQKIDRLLESISSGLALTLYVKKKYSSHTTNHLKKAELLKFVERAVAATGYLAEDEFRYLPAPERYYRGGGEDLKLMDETIALLEPDVKIDLARLAESEIYGTDERIVSITSNYVDGISSEVLVTSNGFSGETKGSYAGITASVSVKGGTGRPQDYWAEYSTHFDGLVKTGIGRKALDRTLQKLNPRKIASGKYPMLVDNMAAGSIVTPFITALYGSAIYQKSSFLAGCAGTRVASEKLSITDSPLIPKDFGSRHFDAEGINAVMRQIVEDGVLKNYFIGTYYGRKLNIEPTTINPSNLVFKTGNSDLESIIKSITKGVLVTGFNGGNCNGSTGDFSYGIEGFLILNGAIAHPVNEMNISGNMKEFWNTLVETGSDPYMFGGNHTPSMLFDNTGFSGL